MSIAVIVAPVLVGVFLLLSLLVVAIAVTLLCLLPRRGKKIAAHVTNSLEEGKICSSRKLFVYAV